MEHVITDYLKELNIKFSKDYILKQITSHPDYPSILAVADTLQRLGIPHAIARSNKENLNDLPLPVLLHLETAGGSLYPVYDEKDVITAADKLGHWSGVLIKVEPTTEIEDREHEKALNEEKRFKILAVVLMLAVSGLVSIPLLLSFSFLQLFLLTTALSGAITGYFLFAKDLGITYRAVESFCNAGTSAGCGKVLRSGEGKLFGLFTFSDLTLGYFATQLLAIGLLAPLWAGSTLLTLLGWLGILAIPMIGYSLWLQAVKIKAWCRLCLVVSGILAVQALIFGYFFYSGLMNPVAVGLPEAAVTLFLLVAVGSSLLLLKQSIQQKNLAVQNEIAATRIKNSPEVFTSLLYNQRQVDITPFRKDFLIGSPDAPINLTMAVNLYCGPCKMELEKAWELLRIYPEQVNLSLRFLKSGDEGKSSDMLLLIWLNQLTERSNGAPDGQVLMDAWYDLMNVEEFSNLFKVNGKTSGNDAEGYLRDHYDWVKNIGITKTPTTYMNGYELPAAYRVKDLFVLIPGLVDKINDVQVKEKEKTVTVQP